MARQSSNRTSAYLQRCLDAPLGDDVPKLVAEPTANDSFMDWVRSVVIHQYEGLHHFFEGRVTENEKGALSEFLDDALCRFFVRAVPDTVRRLQKFERLATYLEASETIQVYFQQSMRCYALGIPAAAVALARACLEDSLRDTLKLPHLEQMDLKGLLTAAGQSKALDATHLQMARTIQQTGNRVLHGRRCTDDQAFGVLVSLRAVVERLYGSDPTD
jgi:hypothetical protein